MRRPYVLLFAVALPCGLAVAGTLRPAPSPTRMGQLARARPERAFAPRLSIETEFVPCRVLPAHPDSTVPREACETAGEPGADPAVFAAAGESFDPDSLHASAVAGVIWWDETEASLNGSVSRLEKALRLSREQTPVLVDLSAVHLVRAERTQNPRDLVAALSYAREALSHEPGNAAAMFNAALALDAMEIEEQAEAAWNAYLAADSASPWAGEARQRMRVLARPSEIPRPHPGASLARVDSFAARYPQEARLMGWDDVLGAWGQAVEKGDSAAAAANLELAERLGRALEKDGGDASLADAVLAVRAAGSTAAATAALARGHRLYAAGQALIAAGNEKAAVDTFRAVLRARPPSPTLVYSAEMFAARALVYENEFERANATFQEIIARIDPERHPALAARAQWMLGSSLLKEGRHAETQGPYQAAYSLYHRVGEVEYAATLCYLIGEAAHLRGDTALAYSSMHRAMRGLRHYRASGWLRNQLMVLADWAAADGMQHASAPIQAEEISVAIRTRQPLARFEALLARAYVRTLTGDISGARRDVDAAAPLLAQIPAGDAAAGRAGAALRMSRAMVQRGQATPRLRAGLDSAVEYFAAQQNVRWLLRALIQRVEVRAATGELAGAAADLDSFTSIIRTSSDHEPLAALRTAMMEQARGRFDRLVMLHLRAGDTLQALRALERGRVSLAPVAAARASAGLRAPRGHVALAYALIGDTLLAWVVHADSAQLHRSVVDRGDFLRTTEGVSAALEAGREGGADGGLRRLYDWLVRPLRDRLGEPGTPLVILADGEVAAVPFAALLDGTRYLVQDRAIRYAPTLADAARERPAHRPARALLIADPAFDAERYPALERLHGARAEAHDLRAFYPDHVLLAEAAATRAALSDHARSVGVIHYAGHAVFNDAQPGRSFLVLADSGATGQLTADSVTTLRLHGVRLVVLSACRTLPSRGGRSGGFAGLSGAMLAAGAGGVVGSLWQVDDQRTRPLMREFHQAYAGTGDGAAALRQAQLWMLRSPDSALRSPSAWAGFRYAGR
ncbi:CHAT domain-containing protein [Longimicrobium sp.]|jgi:CHAT domain-containing protein|uniref:CHAT domain-containing protein n=1 Tax=Longimicrobium sp. TaxID=2029185 RepID=UPI002F925891